MEAHEQFIKAITSRGGDKEQEYACHYTHLNAREFDRWLFEQPKANGVTLYRGYKLERNFFEDGDYSVGAILEPLSLTENYYPAFTTGEIRAVRYINDFGGGLEDDVRILFVLQTSGKYMVDISSLSVYPEEEEHHCCDGAKFKVVKSEQFSTFLRLTLEEV